MAHSIFIINHIQPLSPSTDIQVCGSLTRVAATKCELLPDLVLHVSDPVPSRRRGCGLYCTFQIPGCKQDPLPHDPATGGCVDRSEHLLDNG